jgi:hypothetical protein
MPSKRRRHAETANPRGEPSRRRRRWALGAALAAALALVVGYGAYRATPPLPGMAVADLGNRHVQMEQEVTEAYNSDPPTSGPHLPYLAPWGIHREPVAKALQVHNLEDGGVMVQYSCPSGCAELVERLTAIVMQYPEQVILAPYPGLKQRIALTAWGRIDAFDDFDEARIQRFIRAYRGIDHHR